MSNDIYIMFFKTMQNGEEKLSQSTLNNHSSCQSSVKSRKTIEDLQLSDKNPSTILTIWKDGKQNQRTYQSS